MADGAVVDPYRLLSPVFTDIPREVVEALEADDDLVISKGGAATTSYAKLKL